MSRHRLPIVAAALVAGVATAASYSAIVGAEMTRQAKAALRQIPGVQVATVDADPWSGEVALRGVSATSGAFSLSAARLAFRIPGWQAPAFIAPAYAAGAGTATAEGIVITMPAQTITIPKVEATGTNLTSADLAKIFDPQDPASLAERVRKLEAEKITIPDVIFDIRVSGLTETLRYKDFFLIGAAGGKIQQFGAKSGTLSVSGKLIDGVIEGKLGATRGRDMDLLLYARYLTEKRKSPDEPLQPFYRDTSIDGLEVRGKTFSLTIGAMTGDQFLMRPMSVPAAEFRSAMLLGEKPTPEQTSRMMALLPDVYTSMGFGTLDVKDVAATFGSGAGEAGSLHIAHVGMRDFTNAHVGAMTVDGLRVNATGVAVSFNRFSIQGFDFAPSLGAMKVLGNDPGLTKTDINPRSFIPTLRQLLVTDLDADVPDPNDTGNADDGKREKFKLAKFEFDGSNYQLGIPATGSLTVKHLVLDVPRNASTRTLTQTGFDSLDLSSTIDYAWSEPDGTLSLKELSLSGAGIGSFGLTALFSNVGKDLFVGDAPVAQAALLGARIKSADVRIENSGLVGKFLELTARQSGKTVDQVRQSAIAEARTGLKRLLGDAPQAAAISDAVVAFLQTPKSLAITAKSQNGVSAADLPLLQNPPEFLKRLDVTAAANR